MIDISKLVLGLLEANLGPGKKDKSGQNYTFYCPFCKHHKPKLVVNVESGVYNCWTCYPQTKGRNPVTLLKKMSAPSEHIKEMKSYFSDGSQDTGDGQTNNVSLPKEFKALFYDDDNSLDRTRAMSYLKSRGITIEDIKKYNIGYCQTGRYQNRVIVPSYDKNNMLNYFIARSIDKNSTKKYDAPSCKKSEIIGFESLINWNIPVILCEGSFDAVAIKRNAIPLFGKSIPDSLMKRLVEGDVKTIYLALDRDALKEALDYSEKLLNYGKDVYLLDLKGKDPSKIGFKDMVTLLHSADQLTFGNLFKKKMELI